ncbi:hypothetical protein [Streptomyces sp. NPDC002692]
MNPKAEILAMARRFISGDDRSLTFVNSMEGFAIEHLSDSDEFEFLSEGMSLYRPWAGQPYWSEADMVEMLEDFVKEFGEPEEN